MADRGLRAYAVPSARAGQRPDPAARRDALTGLMTGGFLVAIIAVVLAIVIAAPQYAEPAPAGAPVLVADGEPGIDAEVAAAVVEREVPTSDPPSRLKGYRWPVRKGQVVEYYGQPSKRGHFEVDGVRIRDGIVITGWEGAPVKAAHKGTVVAAGRDWIAEVGYEGSVEEVRERFDRRARKQARKTGQERERFPMGVVIDDGNGYYSVYTELKDLRVKKDDVVKAGQIIGEMSRAEGKQMMRYRLVRMDGPRMDVHESEEKKKGYPGWARERIDPLAVLKTDAKRMPQLVGKRPQDPPRVSEY